MKHRPIESKSMTRFLVSSVVRIGRPFYFGSVIVGLIGLLIIRRWQRLIADLFNKITIPAIKIPDISKKSKIWLDLIIGIKQRRKGRSRLIVIYQAQPVWLKIAV